MVVGYDEPDLSGDFNSDHPDDCLCEECYQPAD